jgi:hypothetical protein
MQTINEKKQQVWFGHIIQQGKGFESIGDYCRANSLSAHAFGYWRTKFLKEKRNRPKKLVSGNKSSFIPVEIKGNSPNVAALPDARWVAEFILNLHSQGGAR